MADHASRDGNMVTTLMAVSSVDGVTPVLLWADPTTHRLLVNNNGLVNPMTTAGDIIYGGTSGVPTRLAIGTSGQVLTVVAGIPGWSTPSAGTVTTVSVVTSSGASGSVSNPTTTPSITLSFATQSSGDNSTNVATTAFVVTAINNAIAGSNPAIAVNYATTASGNTSGLTYNNGASGVGATFTGPNNTAITIDGHTFVVGDVGVTRLLIKNDTQSPSGAFNGVYLFTALQTGITGAVFTRALDYDQPSDINNTGAIPVINGTVNALTSWLQTANIVTVGTTPLAFTQFSYSPISVIGPAIGGTGVANNSANTLTFSGNYGITITLTNTTSITFPTSGTLVNTGVTTLSSLVSIGTITTGVWNGTVIGPAYGGTGVANNASSTITISGSYGLTITLSNTTSVTFPTSGTLAILGANTFTGAQTFLATVQTVTAMATQAVNGALGNVFTRTLAASETFTQSGFTTGQCFIIEVKQGSGTSYTVTWFAGITWVTSGATAPVQTTASGGFTTYGFRCTGTNTFLGYLVGTN